MAITSWAATTGNWNDSKFSRAWDGPNITPAKGDITLSSSSPNFGQEFFVSPGVANLELLQSYEWDQLTTSWITTPGTWTTGPVPEVAVGTGISPDKASLTFTAYSPSSGIVYDFRVTAPTLTLTGQLPAAGEGWTISPDKASIEIIQTYNWNNYGGIWAASSDNWNVVPFVPTAIETGQNEPVAGSLTLSAVAPNRTVQQLWYVPSASLALTGFIPKDLRGHMFYPDTVSLTGLGTTSWADTTGDWSSGSDTWGEGTLVPSAGVTYTFTIDSSGNLVFTPYGSRWPLVSDPKFIATVTLI